MKRFEALISGLPGHIKGRGIAADTWQRSAPVPLDKRTTKPGPARFWLVHLLCPFGKAFYGDWWRNRPNRCPRKVNTYAYSTGWRREAAILIQHMVRWRLTRADVLAQIGTTMTGFYASNAFMSVHHTTLDKLVEASFDDEMDRALVKQRYRGAQISLCANSDEPRVEIVPSCVFLQETSLALLSSTMFTVSKLRTGKQCEKTVTDAEYLHAKCFFLRVTSTMHHPPFFLPTSRNELTRTPLRKRSQKWEKRPEC